MDSHDSSRRRWGEMIALYLFLGAVVVGVGWKEPPDDTNILGYVVVGILMWPVVAGSILAEKDGGEK